MALLSNRSQNTSKHNNISDILWCLMSHFFSYHILMSSVIFTEQMHRKIGTIFSKQSSDLCKTTTSSHLPVSFTPD